MRQPVSLIAVAAAGLLLAGNGFAEPRKVRLPVKMTCPMSDPPLVEEVLISTPGVTTVDIDYDGQATIVTFEDDRTNEAELVAALRDLGFNADMPVAD